MAARKRKTKLKTKLKKRMRKIKKYWNRHRKTITGLTVLLFLFALPVEWKVGFLQKIPAPGLQTEYPVALDEVIGTYTEEPYIILNDNIPLFVESDYTTTAYETYTELDWLGRCGVAMACVGTELMPTEERGSIGQIKPSGWHTIRYDHIEGKYLYNRCHLIAYQLTGENANERNLITGTRYMNVEGMLPFENMVAAYVTYTGRHVLYRVTPIYEGFNLVASGITIEGYSVEDNGSGICFYVYVPNVQPGIGIDYATGESWLL